MENNRGTWKTRSGFLFALIGSAIGLGNIWRFPYVAYKSGGGAFLIPYVIALISVGIPIMVLELAIGHRFRASAPMALQRIGRRWEFLGWWIVTYVFVGIEMYYCVVLSWCANYLRFSFTTAWGDNPGEFFEKSFLGTSSGPYKFGEFNWPVIIGLALIWFINWVVVCRGVRRGIEKATKILIPLLVVIVVVLVIWSLTLPGASLGVKAYLWPDFSKLLEPSVWSSAFSQIFFSLSVAMGIVIAYASYLPAKTNLKTSALITSFANSGFSIFAGFAVFAVLGYMSQVSGKPIDEVVTGGPGLAFVTYPAAINLLPVGKQIFGVLFFLALLFAGITSSISIYEATASSFIDKFGWSRKSVTTVMAIVGFLGGLIFTTGAGLYWLDLIDFVVNNFGLMIAGLLEAVAIGWIYKTHRIRSHVSRSKDDDFCPGDEIIEGGSKSKISRLWEVAIIIWVPLILAVVILLEIVELVQHSYSGYSWLFVGPVGIGWMVMTLMIAWFLKCRGWRSPPAKEKSL